MNESKLLEAKRLHDIGFGIHWIRPNSKAPVKPNWTQDVRDSFNLLKSEYQKGYNVGTKLGTPSQVGGGYLAVIDVDVKSTDPKHQKAAAAKVKEIFKGLLDDAPVTLSGRGNGSMHIWFLVKDPIDSRAIYSCNEKVKVYMPSAKPTKEQIKILGEKAVNDGWRLRPAFEIDLMCAGRQVVLPPSIHPDSGKPYKWKKKIESEYDLQLVEIEDVLTTLPSVSKTSGRPSGGTNEHHTIKITDVDEFTLEMRLPENIVSAIVDGDDVDDRSAMCLSVAMSMLKAGFTDGEVLGVLTNRKFFLGDVAFEHAKTTDRKRAARWADRYCLQKAKDETDFTKDFESEVKVYDQLPPEKAERQKKRLVADKHIDWKKFLDRTDKDKLKPTLKNVILILQNTIAEDLFKRDLFSKCDFYGVSAPWGAKKGKEVSDDDAVEIKVWFANTWKIEPTVNVVFEAIVSIALKNSFHPVRDYLNSLTWDGVPRVNTWLKTYLGAKAKEPYLSEVSRKFLVAAVARIFEPGKKFDHMLILEGLQGIGKSTVGTILAGDKWFLDGLPDLHDKDAALNLQGIWMCEMGELSQLKRNDTETVKAFVTRRIDKVRPPYGKRRVDSARELVFFGSTNAEQYLKDKTGNRRFWPVKVHEVDFDGMKRDRDQLWAEAVYIHDMIGEDLWLKDEAKAQAEITQASRVVEDEQDMIEALLRDWITEAQKLKGAEDLRFRISELFTGFSRMENISPPLMNYRPDNFKLQMASNSLRKIGLKQVRVRGYYWWKVKHVF